MSEFRPALGKPASPAFGERTGEKVDLHVGQFKDGRWSYLYGEDTRYQTPPPAMPDLEAIETRAAREARTGELPEVVQGPVLNPPVWTWEIPLYFWFGGTPPARRSWRSPATSRATRRRPPSRARWHSRR